MCIYTLDLIHEKRQLIQSNLSENELINSSERTVYAEICYANVTWGLLFFISVADIAGARSQAFHSPRHMCCGDVTIKLIWFDFQWAAWYDCLHCFSLSYLTSSIVFLYCFFCWSAYFVHITIVSSSFCLNGLKSFSLFSFSCFWFALLFFPHFVKF